MTDTSAMGDAGTLSRTAHDRPRRARCRALTVVVAVALAGALTPTSARAGLLPGGTTTTTKAKTATTTTTSSPPAGGVVIQGEALPGVTRLASSAAHGGAYGRTVRSSTAAGLAAGTYLVTARVKAPAATRIDLLTADAMAGSYTLGTAWKTVKALITVDGPTQTIGVGSWDRQGAPEQVDVDWLHLATTAPAMTTRGTQVITPQGQPYLPRGFNKGGYQNGSKVGSRIRVPGNEAVEMYVWGPTTVRIGVNQEYWLANCAVLAGAVSTTYRTALKTEIDGLTSRGVNVLISLVGTERGKATGCEHTDGLLREMADSRSLSFWGSVANTYKTNNRVFFDLFNEPHDITDGVWRNGGTVTYGQDGAFTNPKTYTAVGMQGLYNKVRNTGATNLIFISGQRWASDPRVLLSHPVDGYGIVAASHSYCWTCTSDNPHPSPNLESHNSAELRARYPLTLTETGWPHFWSSTFNRAMIDWSEERSVGWLVYGWLAARADGSPDTLSILQTAGDTFDVGGVLTRKPAKSGAPVWNSLAPWRTARGYMDLPQPE